MIHQVYFRPEQRGILEPQFTPYNNEGKLTPYYENSVISELVKLPHDPEEYFGVLSWNLRNKIERMKQYPAPFKNISTDSYSLNWLVQQIEKNDDVIFLMQCEPHEPIVAANRIHPKFAQLWQRVLYQLGDRTYEKQIGYWDQIIYCNFFIAKHRVYKTYVDHFLDPAIEVMNEMPELNEDAKYPLGPGYTYHTFICERLFSYWYNFIYKK